MARCLPILHLNGYKIANPTILARIPPEELDSRCSAAMAIHRISSKATNPIAMHQKMAATLEHCIAEIRAIQQEARTQRQSRSSALADDRAAHAKRMDRPEGSRRAQGGRLLAGAPGADSRCADQSGAPEDRGSSGCAVTSRKNYSTRAARWSRNCANWRQSATRRISANPHANGGLLRKPLESAGLSRLRCGSGRARHDRSARPPICWRSSCAT